MSSSNVTRGLVLMNLGSPDSTSVPDVKKYLSEFLMDKRVIDYSYLFRLLLVRGIIVPTRAPKSAEAYKSIWTEKGSPLILITKELQNALRKEIDEPVTIAMRYGSPSPKDAFDALIAKHPGIKEVTVLPLYPHYAMSSYETAVEYAKEIYAQGNYSFNLQFIKPYYNDKLFVEALCESIRPYITKDYDHILFSYHGIPERHIYKGDITGEHCLKKPDCCGTQSPAHSKCYRHQCFVTTKLVTEVLGITKEKFSISFQSRLGREQWLKPYTADQLKEIPSKGIKKLLVVCPAFASDCLETLEEIAEEGKETFMHAGGESFTLIPCLNVHPLWVNAIAKWIQDINEGKVEMLLQ